MALNLLLNKGQKPHKESLTKEELSHMITPYDMGRLKLFASNMAEYRLIVDLIPTLARVFFVFKAGGMETLKLMMVHQAMLIGIGLQCKSVDTLANEMDLPAKQLLGQFRYT
jgi:N-acetyltransferase 10